MGCIASNLNTTYDDGQELHYISASRVDNNVISGVSFTSTCPSSRTCKSGWSTTPPAVHRNIPPTPVKRRTHSKLRREQLPAALAKLTIGGDLSPARSQLLYIKRRCASDEKSNGYFSASTTPADNTSSACGSIDKNELVYTPDCSMQVDTQKACSNLEMEMYMIKYAPALMTRSSTPLSKRRKLSSNDDHVSYANYKQPTKTFQRWCRHLEKAPRHLSSNNENVLGPNISALPEAITGKFFPNTTPGYTYLHNLPTAATLSQDLISENNGSSDVYATLHSVPSKCSTGRGAPRTQRSSLLCTEL